MPDQVAEEEVRLTVDNSAPTVSPPRATIQINEFQVPGIIYTINAADSDNDNLTFTLANDDGVAQNFFWVHPSEGTVRLMRSLTTISTNRFVVSILNQQVPTETIQLACYYPV